MSARKVASLRATADQLCDDADRLSSGEAWPLYSRAGRLRDEAYLLDEADMDRKLERSARKAREALGAEMQT